VETLFDDGYEHIYGHGNPYLSLDVEGGVKVERVAE